MSNALAIAGTSAVLYQLLNNVFASTGFGAVTVTALAPDIVQSSQNSAPTLQVNLFLHQVTPNAGWRNIGLPSISADGQTRLRNQPLALDLHYLLTAYGKENFEAEALLGYAVQALHQTPVLARSDIQAALNPPPTTGNTNLNGTLDLAGLADQVEMLKVTPATLGREEMAWLWTALKADYRPTYPFQVTVVLIQAEGTTNAPLPVATRNLTVQAGLLCSIQSVTPPSGKSAASFGDTITVSGTGLSNAVGVTLSNAYLGVQYGPIVPSSGTNASIQFVLPSLTTGLNTSPPVSPPGTPLPAGVYSLSVQVQPPGTPTTLSSNSLPLAIAAQIIYGLPASLQGPSFTLSPTCSPAVLARQQVSLILGSQGVVAVPFQSTTSTPTFNFVNITPGTYLVRLRVDGIDSTVNYTPAPGAPVIQVS
jgi:Pvc16 N-terminal domain